MYTNHSGENTEGCSFWYLKPVHKSFVLTYVEDILVKLLALVGVSNMPWPSLSILAGSYGSLFTCAPHHFLAISEVYETYTEQALKNKNTTICHEHSETDVTRSLLAWNDFVHEPGILRICGLFSGSIGLDCQWHWYGHWVTCRRSGGH